MRRRILLLGAGASAPAGLPMSRQMTREMLARIDQSRDKSLSEALHFATGALINYDTQRGGKATDLPDIERLCSAIALLAERDELEIGPFVAAWHEGVTRLDVRDDAGRIQAHGLAGGFTRVLSQRIPSDEAMTRVLQPFVESVVRRVTHPVSGRFAALLRAMFEQLVEILSVPDGAGLAYLDPIFACFRRQGDLTVATLNYDLTVETRARQLHVDVDTGIDGWSTDGAVVFRDGALRLMKLHGSLDWRLAPVQRAGSEWKMPTEAIVLESARAGFDRLGVVFGQRGKLRAEGPFLALLTAFESALRTVDDLVAVGYSFRDDHVNEVIARWTNVDRTRRVIVVDPEFPEPYPYALQDAPFSQVLYRSLWWNGQAPTVNGQPAEPRLVVHRASAASGLATVLAS